MPVCPAAYPLEFERSISQRSWLSDTGFFAQFIALYDIRRVFQKLTHARQCGMNTLNMNDVGFWRFLASKKIASEKYR
jgi:hypothetical protein